MSPGLIVVKKGLELSNSALNTFNSFNFAFSIATIITHFFDLETFLKYTRIESRSGSGEFGFVMPRVSEFAPMGNLGSESEE